VTAINGSLRTPVTNNSLILLCSRERQFCCGCKRSGRETLVGYGSSAFKTNDAMNGRLAGRAAGRTSFVVTRHFQLVRVTICLDGVGIPPR
jgi:hypothetical protein